MCCFSGPVDRVSATRIFARLKDKENQFVVYSMTLSAKSELAMILPIPVRTGAKEDDLHFISLKEYDRFFDDLNSGFPAPRPAGGISRGAKNAVPPPDAQLKVISVGNFEASFVPTVDDFSRLDERFKLPSGTWEKLGDYAKFGFAVFKLKSGEQKVHPMAFEFPTALSSRLFFPTVHVHDGKVHGTADFDHALYAQFDHLDAATGRMRWQESTRNAGAFVNIEKSKTIVNPEAHAYKLTIRGRQKNVDTVL
jgi:hypothetical protein